VETATKANKGQAIGSPLRVVEVAVDDLRPDAANPRRISEAELDALTRSFQASGFINPVLAHQDHSVEYDA
jgi:ParB-like chromosome segregation protein Spo0J